MNEKKGRLMAELVALNVLGVAEVHNEIEITAQNLPKVSLPSETRGSEKSTQQR
jgi:osmotically-inducible protein OsmY